MEGKRFLDSNQIEMKGLFFNVYYKLKFLA